jgi:hypothetical protein
MPLASLDGLAGDADSFPGETDRRLLLRLPAQSAFSRFAVLREVTAVRYRPGI